MVIKFSSNFQMMSFRKYVDLRHDKHPETLKIGGIFRYKILFIASLVTNHYQDQLSNNAINLN